ncbi:DUF3997 domain-containing protein [Inconstantimicrobium mannanitabidum]|uniref:Uncharacterized protein n=1 Tax=Inconstantimicrobium mannanitabidum TaxID=1604901 RepID=A0ACB5RIQ1_9CLOT|nr:DUF3997 domain-containing protein [Clostridium sp. TW13]GKX68959.1 hypothetical protein rsdtw13_42170 [Clostridium sp. TW13]
MKKKKFYIFIALIIPIIIFFIVKEFIINFVPPVSGGGDFSYNITKKYKFARTNRYSSYIYDDVEDNDLCRIDTFVDSFGFDDNFIIAKQVRPKEVYHDEIYTPKVPDENETWYWIMDIKIDKRYGPYKNLNDFNKAKNQLKVSNNIKLYPYNHYRK